MKNTRRFFLSAFPEEPAGVTSVRMTYNSLEVAGWLNNNPAAISRYRAQVRNRLKKQFPGANIAFHGTRSADGYTWQIVTGAGADQAEALLQCEEILEQVKILISDWMPKKA